jgi:hypothetical protein
MQEKCTAFLLSLNTTKSPVTGLEPRLNPIPVTSSSACHTFRTYSHHAILQIRYQKNAGKMHSIPTFFEHNKETSDRFGTEAKPHSSDLVISMPYFQALQIS